MSSTIQIHGNNTGQVAQSESGEIRQTGTFTTGAQADPLEIARARQEFEHLVEEIQRKIAAGVDPDKQAGALERTEELKESLSGPKPDLGTLEYVKNWFVKNAPRLAGDVTGLIVHPIVGKLVEAAGELVAAEFRRRFFPGQSS